MAAFCKDCGITEPIRLRLNMNKGLRTTILRCLIAALILIATNVVGQTVKLTVEPTRDFSGFSKYAWRENHIVSRQSPDVNARMEQAIKDAINSQLAQKGYSLMPNAPDFLISVEALPVDDFSLSGNTDFSLPTGTTVYTSQRPGGLGVSVLAAVIPQMYITATDPSSNTPLWQSMTTKKYKNPEKAVKNLDKELGGIVRKAMKSFPSGKSAQKLVK